VPPPGQNARAPGPDLSPFLFGQPGGTDRRKVAPLRLCHRGLGFLAQWCRPEGRTPPDDSTTISKPGRNASVISGYHAAGTEWMRPISCSFRSGCQAPRGLVGCGGTWLLLIPRTARSLSTSISRTIALRRKASVIQLLHPGHGGLEVSFADGLRPVGGDVAYEAVGAL
jgi:hypothetical protein